MAGRDDTPLPSREYDAITEAGTGKRVRVLQENDLDGSVGRTSYDTVTRV
jgi:hypothetical protein